MQIDINTVSPEIKSWLHRVQQGESIVFIKQGEIIGKLTPSSNVNQDAPKPKRQAGLLSGVSLNPAFFEPLEEDELKIWQGDD